MLFFLCWNNKNGDFSTNNII